MTHPADCFPPRQDVYGRFLAWRDREVWKTADYHLLVRDRKRTGREASPSTAIIDGKSVKTTEAGVPRGYGAGRKAKGRKRQAMGVPLAPGQRFFSRSPRVFALIAAQQHALFRVQGAADGHLEKPQFRRAKPLTYLGLP